MYGQDSIQSVPFRGGTRILDKTNPFQMRSFSVNFLIYDVFANFLFQIPYSMRQQKKKTSAEAKVFSQCNLSSYFYILDVHISRLSDEMHPFSDYFSFLDAQFVPSRR